MLRVSSGSWSLKVSVFVIVSTLLGLFVFSTVLADTTGTLMPLADGNYTQWTPSTGTSHFALVDETPCNGTTDYNSTTVVGRRDSYAVSTTSVPNGATITQIAIKPCASRASTGGANPVMNVFYRFGGINSADSGSYALTGTTPVELATTTYSGLSLVKTSTTTLEVGAVLTSSTKGARLSRIATVVTYTALAAPSGLSGSATTSSAVGLSWTDNASNETGFNVERSTDAVNWGGIATTSANTSSYYDSGLSASTTYYYRVRTFNYGAYSAYTNIATSTTKDNPPADPSDLSLSTTVGTSTADVTLTWTDNSTNESAFEIQRDAGSGYTHLASTTANATSSVDQDLSAGTYSYRVRAFGTAGYSGFSNIASTTVVIDPPATPTDLLATASSTDPSIVLTWTDTSSNETGFRIWRSLDNVTFLPIATTSFNVTSYKNTGIASSTTYYYGVIAFNSGGQSATSSIASTTSSTVPSAPSGLSLSTQPAASSTTDIILDWSDNAYNEVSYSIERSIGTSTFSKIATTSPDAITYTDAQRPAGTYSYRLRGWNGWGYSAYSNTASTTTP